MSMRVVIVGASDSGLALAERLAARHEVVVVGLDGTAEERVQGIASRCSASPSLGDAPTAPRAVVGDGTSRLVLKRVHDEHAESALVALAGSDEVNLEVGRAGREVGFDPVVAILHDPCAAPQYAALGITAIDRAQLVADQIERTLEFKGEVVPCGIGLGRGEIVEIRLASTSPMLGRPLKTIAPDRWRIAAVFRADELIVPVGETTLEEDDRVLLVGQPGVLANVARYLRVGTPQFPRQFGPNVVTFEPGGRDEAVADEARALATACEVRRVFRGIPSARASAPPQPAAAEGQPALIEELFSPPPGTGKEAHRELARQRPGVVAVRPLRRPLAARILGRRGVLATICDAVEAPVLFCRGTQPYKRILLPVSDSEVSIHAAELAIDVTRLLGATLTAINVDLPRYISGEPEELRHEEVAPIRRLCALYGVTLDYRHEEGNPIRRIVREASRHDLVVVARRHKRQDSFWSPDVACRVARRAPCSVLVLTDRRGG